MTDTVDAVTLDQAAGILDCSISTVRRHILTGRLESDGARHRHRRLSRHQVEQLVVEVYDWRKHRVDPAPYWVTGRRAAEVLGVNRARLDQPSRAGRVPYLVHRDGVRLYRRARLEVIGSARAARRSR